MLQAVRGRAQRKNYGELDDFKWWYEDMYSRFSLESIRSWLHNLFEDEEGDDEVDPEEPPIFGSPEPPVHLATV